MPVIQAEQMRQLTRQEPFQPFRIHTKRGEVFEIRDPMQILVAEWVVVVPVGVTPENPYGDYGASVEYDQIVRVEPLETAPVLGGKG